jgi:hypothetical protein
MAVAVRTVAPYALCRFLRKRRTAASRVHIPALQRRPAALLPSAANAAGGHCDTKATVRTGMMRAGEYTGAVNAISFNAKIGPDEPWWCRRATRGLPKLFTSAEAAVMGCIRRVRGLTACAAKHCLRRLLTSGDSLRTEIRWRRALRPLTLGVRCRAIAHPTPERRSVRNSSGPCTYTTPSVTVCQYPFATLP